MAQVKFFRGTFEKYVAGSTHKDAIYFSTNTNELFLNGVAYGLSKDDAAKLNDSVVSVNYDEASRVVTVSYNDKAATTFTLPVATSSVDGLMSKEDKAAFDTLNGAIGVEGSVKYQVNAALEAAKSHADALVADGSAIDVRIDALEAMVGESGEGNSLADRVAANETAIQANADAIDAIEADYLKAADKTELSNAIGAETTAREQAISGLVGDAADEYNTLGKLEDKIQAVEAAAKSYSIAKLTDDEVTALGDANVKEAYQLVDEDSIKAGEVIKIYKDSSLKSVALADQTLNFTYILADGSESTVGVDVSAFLAESEFGDGLQVVDHVVSVKKDALSEDFLSVSADGIKLAGVQAAINAAESAAKGHADGLNTAMDTRVKELEAAIGENGSVSEQIAAIVEGLDATVGSQTVAEGKHVAVEVVEENGKLTGLTVTESDIASAKEFSEYKTSNDAAVKAADDAAKAAQSHSEGVAGDLAEYETANDTRVKAVEDSLAEAGSVGAKIKANADAIAVLNGTEEGSVKKAVADAKATIDAYTVNEKAISTNPVLDATDIKLGTYTAVDNSIDITATTTIANAIKALEDAWTWGEA